MFNQLIAEFIAETEEGSQLINRGVVIDYLLDLRSAAENSDLCARVDRYLTEVPGVTVVTNEWWAETLGELSKASRFVALV